MTNILGLTAGRTKPVAGKYEATAFLSRGRFADVFRAYDIQARTDLAIKIYRNEGNANPEDVAKREHGLLKRLAEVGSPFFPKPGPILTTRISGVRHWFVTMELAKYVWDDPVEASASCRDDSEDGTMQRDVISLFQILPGSQLDSATAIRECGEFWTPNHLRDWILDLCEAVRILHGKDVLHLDLKPGNIMLKRPAGAERCVPFIIDFNTSLALTAGAFVGGTTSYQAPEVRSGA